MSETVQGMRPTNRKSYAYNRTAPLEMILIDLQCSDIFVNKKTRTKKDSNSFTRTKTRTKKVQKNEK